jgi:SanA protein
MTPERKGMKRILLLGWSLLWKAVLAVLIFSISVYVWVDWSTDEFLYEDISELPKNRVGLLLGTSKYVPEGGINLYYKNRIDAAVELYRAGKIDKVIASGDNATMEYNEPVKMQRDLMARGIRKKDIALDYAGFSTLDAVVRAKAIFSQSELTIISQGFHDARAVYIAREKGMDAVGYKARGVSTRYGLMTHLREYLARVKMILDLYILHTEPKFYGEKVEI